MSEGKAVLRNKSRRCETRRPAAIGLTFWALGLASCTQYWAKPGGTVAEFDATKAACQTQAYAQFPPLLQQVMISPGYTTPLQTTCSGTGYLTNCFTTGGQYIPPAYMNVDNNENARGGAFKTCLYSAGWRPVKDKAEAEAVTNSVAHSDPVNAAHSDPVNMSGRQFCDLIFSQPKYEATRGIFDNSYQTCVAKRTADIGY